MAHSHGAKHHEGGATVQLGPPFVKHASQPKNIGRLDRADGRARGVGTCGDGIEVFLQVENHTIRDIKHIPDGCAYTVACASAMSMLAKGRSLAEALHLKPEALIRALGGLPDRHRHCAALAINTLGEAIEDYYRKIWGKG